ncbi:MAG TPA: SpoIIE family protein phosphatase [Chitinivibrionales bacterium]|nr:SpoIIE family protein phosphatase [Chitinivibrionales bacterium]
MTTQPRILVVDDIPDNRELLCRLLVRQGYAAEIAGNGQEALVCLAKEKFDCVLLDIMMPVLGGIETLSRLRADEALRHIPVIVVSAVDDVDNVVKCIGLGAEDYLFKPVNKVLLSARVSASLEKKRLRDQEQAYTLHVKHELELGRQIQADFLPESLPRPDGWEVAVSFEPAFEVAGDFYDAFMIGEERLCFVIADVCGKGVGAALFMSLVRSLIRAYAEQAKGGDNDILHAVTLTNSYLTRYHRMKNSFLFTTLLFGVINTKLGTLKYIAAGHYPPLILTNTGVISSLTICGPALGIINEPDFAIKEAQLSKGDILLAYTDGIIEAKNAAEELYSKERLVGVLESRPQDAKALLVRVEAGLANYIGDTEQSDDITMMAIKRL